jgi:hypothetical protein
MSHYLGSASGFFILGGGVIELRQVLYHLSHSASVLLDSSFYPFLLQKVSFNYSSLKGYANNVNSNKSLFSRTFSHAFVPHKFQIHFTKTNIKICCHFGKLH